MWCRLGLFCSACWLVEVPAGLYFAVVDFSVALGLAGFDECGEKFVVDVNAGLPSVAVGAGEVDAVYFLLGFLYGDVAGASVP